MNNDVFVTTTPYQLLQSCYLCNNNSVLIANYDFYSNLVLSKLIDTYFQNRVIRLKPFGAYKEHPISFATFRNQMLKIKKRIDADYEIRDIYVFSDVDPVTQWLSKNIYHSRNLFIVEEGIGLYRDSSFQHKAFFNLFGKVVFGRTYEKVNRMGESSAVTDILCTSPELLSYKQRGKTIHVQERHDFSIIQREIGISPLQNVNWFVGQPLVEDGVTSQIEYMQVVDHLNQLCLLQGKKLIIKPHPRENVLKYNSKYDVFPEKDTPIELLIDTKDNTNIYSIYSSAVFSVTNVDNIRVFALYKLLKNTTLSETLNDIFSNKGIKIINEWHDLEIELRVT